MLYISAAMTRSRLFLLLGILLAAGCYSNSRDRRPSDDDDDAADDDDATDDDDTGGTLDCEPEGVTSCLANTFVECSGGNWSEVETCSDDAPICDPDLGCLTCNPGRDTCDGNDVVACNDAGTAFTFVRTCEPGTTCLAGDCVDACDLARQRLSYLGCEFLASTTSNSLLSGTFDSDFGIAIGNPGENGGPAEITVMRGGAVVTTASVPPGTTAAITLPYVAELKNATESVTVVDGAYEITSTQPVAAYQYNPLHFDIGGTPSYTNDASLLLPEHTLTGSYMVGTWPTWGKGSWVDLFGSSGNWDTFYPGFVTVVGTADNTTVTFASNTTTSPGNPGALGPGGSTSITLNRGDVVQIFSQAPDNPSDPDFCRSQGGIQTDIGTCPPTFTSSCDSYCSFLPGDLTGSTILADAPVAVFAGHMCTFMPASAWACDHLEEMMFPTETWGTLVVMTAPAHPSGSGVADAMYRVVALDDATDLTFNPAIAGPATLGAGEHLEFRTNQDFTVQGSGKIYVIQAMLGEDELLAGSGDPAMGSGIPRSQFRDAYDFLTPDTYTSNWLNVVAPTGTEILLDGAAVTGWAPVFGAGFDVARVAIPAGSHEIHSSGGERFGITSYGYANYTSYLYPGGMNFGRGG
jgi:hypothetical protein